jgi:hypothetical protein
VQLGHFNVLFGGATHENYESMPRRLEQFGRRAVS